ncbi:MAG: FHA domain-containing protein [Myxococcota bacterium]
MSNQPSVEYPPRVHCALEVGASTRNSSVVEDNEQTQGLVIGSHATAGWQVVAPGVAPLHVELFHYQGVVWVTDLVRTGLVSFSGCVVGEWTPIAGSGVLVVGEAHIRISPLYSGPAVGPCEGLIDVETELMPVLLSEVSDGPTALFQRSLRSPPSEQAGESAPASAPVENRGPASSPKSGSRHRGRLLRRLGCLIVPLGIVLASFGIVVARASSGAEAPVTIPTDALAAAPMAARSERAPTPLDTYVSEVEPLPAGGGAEREGEAAALVANNRFAQALRVYRELATAHPMRLAFRDMVSILERRVQAGCLDGVDPMGESCE